MSKDEERLYELEFSVEVSAIYHEWRRAAFESFAVWIRATVFLGAVLSLIFAFAVPSDHIAPLVATASAIIGIISLIDLIVGVDSRARKHTELYERFRRLEADIAKHRDSAPAHINEWEAEAKLIRVDEPSVFWAIYVTAWNQSLGKRRVVSGQYRRITWWQSQLRGILHFRPMDFPLVGGGGSP